MLKPAALCRETFSTSRLSEFTSVKELVNQTGHPIEQWPLVILKELVDNALDAAEDSDIAPEIDVTVSTERGEIIVADNGQGIPPETVTGICDYTIRISSREAYVSPTRGAQGNALKTIVAMPFALDNDTPGDVVIEARSVAHRIVFGIDRVRREPVLQYTQTDSLVRNGTRVIVHWPVSAY
jgi:DNA topoisomerase VI subunit B